MTNAHRTIWFWQRIVSPHMAGLAIALSRQGLNVTYVAEQIMTDARARQGWSAPDLEGVTLKIASTTKDVERMVAEAAADSIHICQGIRANGVVAVAQRALATQNMRQWVVMEAVEDSGWQGFLKRFEYRRLFLLWRKKLEGVLATGDETASWVALRGFPADKIFPFAYFLPEEKVQSQSVVESFNRFRFLFVGRFIETKHLDLLISALSLLSRSDAELAIIGSGPLENDFRVMAEKLLPDQVHWIGHLPMDEVKREMIKADCLVLPSRYDGWGAVVSEALMVGTPAICSDRCGSAVAVRASGYGGVFCSEDLGSLSYELEKILGKGSLPFDEKLSLVNWAQCLGAVAGACYLRKVFAYVSGIKIRPTPPWGGKV